MKFNIFFLKKKFKSSIFKRTYFTKYQIYPFIKKKKERKRKYQIYPKKRANIFKIRKGYELEIMKGSDGIVFLNPS